MRPAARRKRRGSRGETRAHFRPNSFSMSPCASFTQVGRPWLHWPLVRRHLHLAEQRVHLGDRQHAAGADRCRGRPWSRRHDRAAPSATAPHRTPASSSARSVTRPFDVGRARAAPASPAPASRAGRTARAPAPSPPARRSAPPAGRRPARPARPLRAAAAPARATPPLASARRIRSSTSRSCAACWSTSTSPSSASATI